MGAVILELIGSWVDKKVTFTFDGSSMLAGFISQLALYLVCSIFHMLQSCVKFIKWINQCTLVL
jgi:hypothetical protein